jgi:hypothetical protein
MDVRLSLYLGVYALCQCPSVGLTVASLFGPADQLATLHGPDYVVYWVLYLLQPLQGTADALVFARHSRRAITASARPSGRLQRLCCLSEPDTNSDALTRFRRRIPELFCMPSPW